MPNRNISNNDDNYWAWEPQPSGGRSRTGTRCVATPRRYHHIAAKLRRIFSSAFSARGGVVRLDRSGTFRDSLGLVLDAASGQLFADGPRQPGAFLVLQHSPSS